MKCEFTFIFRAVLTEGQTMTAGSQLRSDARFHRTRIVAAATEVFVEKGRAAEIKDIADRAGVAVGTLYRHFTGKADLLGAILQSALATMVAEARAAEQQPDPLTALRALLQQACTSAERYGWLVEMMLSGQIAPETRERLRSELAEENYLSRFERTLGRAIAAGRLRPDVDVAAAALLLEGVATPWLYRRYHGQRTPAEITDAVLAVLLRGALPPGSG